MSFTWYIEGSRVLILTFSAWRLLCSRPNLKTSSTKPSGLSSGAAACVVMQGEGRVEDAVCLVLGLGRRLLALVGLHAFLDLSLTLLLLVSLLVGGKPGRFLQLLPSQFWVADVPLCILKVTTYLRTCLLDNIQDDVYETSTLLSRDSASKVMIFDIWSPKLLCGSKMYYRWKFCMFYKHLVNSRLYLNGCRTEVFREETFMIRRPWPQSTR